jgi:ribosomal protein L7Ae-like RNA K-turn-binding protein
MSKNKIYSFIGLARKAGMAVIGEDSASLAIKDKKASLVLLADDASQNTEKKIRKALSGSRIQLMRFGSREELGHALGKVYISVIAITDKGFSNQIIKMVQQNMNNTHGGDVIE